MAKRKYQQTQASCHRSQSQVRWIVLLLIAVTTISTTTVTAVASVEDGRQQQQKQGIRGRRSLESSWMDDLSIGKKRTLQQCRNLSDILCETSIFDSFCELLIESGLYDDLSGDFSASSWTVFAPTNTALEEILDTIDEEMIAVAANNDTESALDDELDEDDLLTDLLKFHMIRDRMLSGINLACNDTLLMNNGKETKVFCDGDDGLYLVGSGNTERPRVVVTDVVACNGIIHVIDGVLIDSNDDNGDGDENGDEDDDSDDIDANTSSSSSITNTTVTAMEPVEPDQKPYQDDTEPPIADCRPIQEVVCGLGDLSTICAYLYDDRILTDQDDDDSSPQLWTLFAPTNEAFEYIEDILDRLDEEAILDILKFHTINGEELFSDDLECEADWLMGNGQSSTTTCSAYSGYTYQVGSGNANPRNPRIINTDRITCDGVVHIVNYVMLPDF